MNYYIFYGADFGSENKGNYTPQLFFDREDAVNYMKRIIRELTETENYVIDSEFDERSYDEQDFVSCICFYQKQENWNDYCDFSIEPIKAR